MVDRDSRILTILPIAAVLLWTLGTTSPATLADAADDLVALGRSPGAVQAMIDGLASEVGPWSASDAPGR